MLNMGKNKQKILIIRGENSAAKLTKLILNENLRRELKKNGLQRAKEKFD